MKIAAGQFTSVPGDIGANVDSMRGLVRAAAGQGAALVRAIGPRLTRP